MFWLGFSLCAKPLLATGPKTADGPGSESLPLGLDLWVRFPAFLQFPPKMTENQHGRHYTARFPRGSYGWIWEWGWFSRRGWLIHSNSFSSHQSILCPGFPVSRRAVLYLLYLNTVLGYESTHSRLANPKLASSGVWPLYFGWQVWFGTDSLTPIAPFALQLSQRLLTEPWAPPPPSPVLLLPLSWMSDRLRSLQTTVVVGCSHVIAISLLKVETTVGLDKFHLCLR